MIERTGAGGGALAERVIGQSPNFGEVTSRSDRYLRNVAVTGHSRSARLVGDQAKLRKLVVEGYPSGAVWPATDYDDIQVREVYSRYGLAMFMVQVLEHGMANAEIIFRTLPTIRLHPDEASWHATIDRSYEIGLARTYGNMLKQLERLDEFPQLLLERLRWEKEDRDVLAHRFFRQNDLAFMNRDGRTSMIASCERRIELFQSLSDDLDIVIMPIRERYGISEAWIDSAMERSLENARNRSPEASHAGRN